MNRIFHPNIDEPSGSVCLDVINQTWTPLYDLKNIFDQFLPQLLTYPNPSDPLNGEAATMYLHNREQYIKRVKDTVKKYATAEILNKTSPMSDSESDSEEDEPITSRAAVSHKKRERTDSQNSNLSSSSTHMNINRITSRTPTGQLSIDTSNPGPSSFTSTSSSQSSSNRSSKNSSPNVTTQQQMQQAGSSNSGVFLCPSIFPNTVSNHPSSSTNSHTISVQNNNNNTNSKASSSQNSSQSLLSSSIKSSFLSPDSSSNSQPNFSNLNSTPQKSSLAIENPTSSTLVPNLTSKIRTSPESLSNDSALKGSSFESQIGQLGQLEKGSRLETRLEGTNKNLNANGNREDDLMSTDGYELSENRRKAEFDDEPEEDEISDVEFSENEDCSDLSDGELEMDF